MVQHQLSNVHIRLLQHVQRVIHLWQTTALLLLLLPDQHILQHLALHFLAPIGAPLPLLDLHTDVAALFLDEHADGGQLLNEQTTAVAHIFSKWVHLSGTVVLDP